MRFMYSLAILVLMSLTICSQNSSAQSSSDQSTAAYVGRWMLTSFQPSGSTQIYSVKKAMVTVIKADGTISDGTASSTGKYTVQGNKFTITMPNRPPTELQWSVSGSTLTLETNKGAKLFHTRQ